MYVWLEVIVLCCSFYFPHNRTLLNQVKQSNIFFNLIVKFERNLTNVPECCNMSPSSTLSWKIGYISQLYVWTLQQSGSLHRTFAQRRPNSGWLTLKHYFYVQIDLFQNYRDYILLCKVVMFRFKLPWLWFLSFFLD